MKLSTEQSTWELFASCEDQLKAECQLFHFKLQTHVPTHPWEFFSTLDGTQHVGVWKHFESVALNIFFASCQNSILLLCHKWKNICAGSKMNKYGNWVWPWVRVGAALGWRGGLPSSRGNFWEIPTLWGYTALYSLENSFSIWYLH